MEKKICMTGASGHVGYAVLKELEKQQDSEIRILMLDNDCIFGDLGENVKLLKGNITKYDTLLPVFKGCDVVYHIAGIVEIKKGNEQALYAVNVKGTENVIKACKECGVKKLVYMSSVDTYLPLPDNQVMHEIYDYNPDVLEGAYAKTKAEATAKVLAANEPGVLETVVVQPSACMGPYDYKVSPTGSMIRMMSSGKLPITMTFGAYNFVDVRDVAIGTVAAGNKAPGGQVYILCNKTCTVDEFLRLLNEAWGNKPPKIKLGKKFITAILPLMELYYKLSKQTPIFTAYAVRKLCSNCNFSYEKANKELGYNPRPLSQSLKDTVQWIKENENKTPEKHTV